MRIASWVVKSPGEPMILEPRDEDAGPDEVIIEVAGCGVCHTDLSYYYEGVPLRGGYPRALGHEIAGRVVAAGDGAGRWVGQDVVVPAVIPCGACDACRAGRGAVCPDQVFPGNDVHGGFGTHVRVPAHGLCPVPDLGGTSLSLADLAVIADAVTTPYQAVLRSGLEAGDLAVFVGAGGIGGFGVQIAAARGAHVIAFDPSEERRALAAEHGAAETCDPRALSFKELKQAVKSAARERGIPSWRHRIFEASGTPVGQTTAFGLLGPGGHLSIVGFTRQKVEVRLSNLMAFDATVQGNWGCVPDHYPAVLDLVLSGKVAVAPFVEHRPLDAIHQTFDDIHHRRTTRRVILRPS